MEKQYKENNLDLNNINNTNDVNVNTDLPFSEVFVKSLYGSKIYIKLIDDTEYIGNLVCLDGLLNLLLENCEEIESILEGSKDKSSIDISKIENSFSYSTKRKLKETYIRGNNVFYISEI